MRRDYVFSFVRRSIDLLPWFAGLMFVMWTIGFVRF